MIINQYNFNIGGYSTEYQAVLDSWTTLPSDAVKEEQNTMVVDEIAAGVWYSKDVWYVFAAHTNDNGEALTNWRNPGTHDATMVNNPIFTAFEGFLGNGTTQYIDTNYNAFTQGVNYTQNDASLSTYNRNEAGTVAGILLVAEEGTTFGHIIPAWSDGNSYLRVNSAQAGSFNVGSTLGDYINTRNGLNIATMYINTVGVTGSSAASTYIPNINYTILGSATGFFYPGQVARAALGSGLSAGEVADETNIFEAYMDSNGKGVIT